MADPVTYTPEYSFSGFQAVNPSRPLPADQVDAELANVSTSVGELVEAVKNVRRSDGLLKNGVVTPESLSSATLTLLATGGTEYLGAWVTATAYTTGQYVTQSGSLYFCIVAHTAGVFATDLAANKWAPLTSDDAASVAFAPTGTISATNVQTAVAELDSDISAISAANWVTTTRINAQAVTTAKLADDAVTVDKLADNAVATGSIVGLAVTDAKLATNSVTTTKIADGSVTAAKLASDAVAHICHGRLTTASGVPVTVTDNVSAGDLYFTPYRGNQIALNSGTGWVLRSFTEITLSLASGFSSGKPYDVFAYDNAGVVALEALAWTDDTTRATALTTQDGVYVKTGAVTRRYIGTFRTVTATTTEDSAAKRYVWNYYNRVPRVMRVTEATDTWTYTTATIRQANGSTANQIGFMLGVSEDVVSSQVLASARNTNVGVNMIVGIGLDSTVAFASGFVGGYTQSQAANQSLPIICTWTGYPGVGLHYLAWLEYSSVTGTTTWVGDNGGPNIVQSGITGTVMA